MFLLAALWLVPLAVLKPPSPKEQLLLGRWRSAEQDAPESIVLEFLPDGRVLERRPGSGEKPTGYGRWQLEGDALTIRNSRRMPEFLGSILGTDQRPDGITPVQIEGERLQLGAPPTASVFQKISD
jgi:hypothetical protein